MAVLALDGVHRCEPGSPSRILGAAGGSYGVPACPADGRPVRTSADFGVTVEYGPEILETADTVIVASVPSSRIPTVAGCDDGVSPDPVVRGAPPAAPCSGPPYVPGPQTERNVGCD